MLGAAIASFPIIWRTDGDTKVVMVPVGTDGPMRDKTLTLKYEKERDILSFDKSVPVMQQGQDPGAFSRIKR